MKGSLLFLKTKLKTFSMKGYNYILYKTATIIKKNRSIFNLLTRIYIYILKKPYQIVVIDGGICSQIFQYYIGQLLVESGLEVKYDLSFFENWGLDIDGKEPRRYELEKLYPHLIVDSEIPTICRGIFFKTLFLVHERTINQERLEKLKEKNSVVPQFYGNYYNLTSAQRSAWKNYYRKPEPASILNVANMEIYQLIKNCPISVGVHIRRGDLAEYRPETGYFALGAEYFIRTMSYQMFDEATFFVFSNDMEWFKQYVIPKLVNIPLTRIYMITENIERAYCDLYLLGACMHQISSQGSFGRMAYELLNDYENKKLVRPVRCVNDIVKDDSDVIFCDLRGEIYS